MNGQNNQQTILLADLRCDADAGWALMKELDRKWFHEGVQHFRAGQPVDVCWNHVQRAGYRAAQTVTITLAQVQQESVYA